jgi:nitroimidazol reductase NimA-like FMN-containing flavoprotein (pyridoxamine 5'-phosphate oxidase superfamily)
MSSEDEAFELESLSRDECLRLLATVPIGRVAVIGPNGAPHVVPVNFVVHDDCILFRSDEGLKLAAMGTQLVTFQVDCFDPGRRVGWSVMIHGRGREVSELPRSIVGWTSAARHVVCIEADEIVGRQIVLHHGATDDRGYL